MDAPLLADDSASTDPDDFEWITVKYPVVKGRYEVCKEGFVRNKESKRVLQIWKDKAGYPMISMNVGKSRSWYIHRVMGEHFIENPDPVKYTIVHHIDENPNNWSLSNLKWTDQKGNMKAHFEFRKTTGKIFNTRKVSYRIGQYDKKTMKEIKIWDGLDQVANAGFNKDSVSGTCTFSHNNHKGYVWRYIDTAGTIITKGYSMPVLDGEEFKLVGDCRGKTFSNHRISNFGRLLNKRSDLIQPNLKKKYPTVSLVDDTGKDHTIAIHLLVANGFVEGETVERNEVHHIDADTTNWRASNLRWVTSSENKTAAIGIAVEQLDAMTEEILHVHDNTSMAGRHLGKTYSIGKEIKKCCEDGKARLGYKWRRHIVQS